MKIADLKSRILDLVGSPTKCVLGAAMSAAFCVVLSITGTIFSIFWQSEMYSLCVMLAGVFAFLAVVMSSIVLITMFRVICE